MDRKPERIALSKEALSLFRLHLERHGDLDAEANRAAYQELERAGLMAVGHSFRDGRNSIYRLTKEGFERKAEILAISPSPYRGAARPA
jgi:DNA-binding MarR family transcriptional regulator